MFPSFIWNLKTTKNNNESFLVDEVDDVPVDVDDVPVDVEEVPKCPR